MTDSSVNIISVFYTSTGFMKFHEIYFSEQKTQIGISYYNIISCLFRFPENRACAVVAKDES